jgi:glycerophosphoryl diester phosphodiesterase
MARTSIGIVVTATAFLAASVLYAPGAAGARKALRCPLIFGHGGYPKGPDATRKDRIRQANNPTAVDHLRAMGADGVEADVQLTRNGSKAVMWHNHTTNGLTGPRRRITDLRWSTGPGSLSSRRVARGPYEGERVYTLREWLAHAAATHTLVLLEIKPQAKRILGSKAHAAAGWRQIVGPIRERDGRDVMVYSTDPWIQDQLARRLPDHLRGPHARWTDGVDWDEPPPSWEGNIPRWTSILKLHPVSVMTNYPAEYRLWLADRCA